MKDRIDDILNLIWSPIAQSPDPKTHAYLTAATSLPNLAVAASVVMPRSGIQTSKLILAVLTEEVMKRVSLIHYPDYVVTDILRIPDERRAWDDYVGSPPAQVSNLQTIFSVVYKARLDGYQKDVWKGVEEVLEDRTTFLGPFVYLSKRFAYHLSGIPLDYSSPDPIPEPPGFPKFILHFTDLHTKISEIKK